MAAAPASNEKTLIASLADSVIGARSLEALVRPMLEMLESVTGLESTYMTTIDEVAGVQHVLFSSNTRQLQIPEGISVPWRDTLCKRALDEGTSFTDDVAGCWGDSEAASALGIATYASMPIMSNGNLQGTLCAASGERMPLREDTESVLRMFSYLIGQHIEREQLMKELREANVHLTHHSMTDPVTGLPNRRALTAELDRRLLRRDRDEGELLIAFIDLDGFKQINDQFGHEAGDRFLSEIARRLTTCHRGEDFTARLGGDEFVVLGNTAHTDTHAEQTLFKRLETATRGRFDLGEHTLDYAGPSIGIVTADHDEAGAEAAIARADAAMYEIKRQRKALSAAQSL